MAETVLAKMAVEIAANTAQFTRSLQNTESRLAGFSNELKSIGNTIGIAFGVGAVTSFAFEVAKLAGEAEAVQAAFDRFPESEILMNRLKQATAGTVSELDLMKRTVQASNFGIELQSLPQLLEFAAVRAQQTGQSVDYLVDSIVTGIGRKSPLILDNLGISAVALREKMNGVSLATADIADVSRAVGEIASEELQKMGGFSENTATKVARLSASWDNFKVVLGGVVTAGGVLSRVLDNLSGILDSVANPEQADFRRYQMNLAEALRGGSESVIRTMVKELNTLRNELNTPIEESFVKQLITDYKLNEQQGARFLKIIREINGEVKNTTPIKTVDPVEIVTLESLQAKVKELNDEFANTDIVDKQRLTNIGQEIIAVNQQIKTLEELRKARENANKVDFAAGTVGAYQKAIQDLNAELTKTNVNDTERIRVLSASIAGYQEAIARVEALKNSFKGMESIRVPVPDLSPLLDGLRTIQETDGTITWSRTITATEEMVKRFEAGMAKLRTSTKQTQETLATIDLTGPIASGISGIAEALGAAAAGVGDFGKDILKVVAGFGKQLGEILIAQGVALLAAKFALKNPYTAIAAGVALVAISSAMSASISRAHSNTFGGGGSAATRSDNVSRVDNLNDRPVQIQFNAEFEIQGSKLVALVNSENTRGQRLKG